MAIANVFINITGTLINVWATRKLLPYSYVKQLKDVSVYVIIAFAIGWVTSLVVDFDSNILNVLFFLIIILIAYALVLMVFKDQIFLKYLNRYVKNRIYIINDYLV